MTTYSPAAPSPRLSRFSHLNTHPDWYLRGGGWRDRRADHRRPGGLPLGGHLRRLQRLSVCRVERRRGERLPRIRPQRGAHRSGGRPRGGRRVSGRRSGRRFGGCGCQRQRPARAPAAPVPAMRRYGKAPSVSGPSGPGTGSPTGDVPHPRSPFPRCLRLPVPSPTRSRTSTPPRAPTCPDRPVASRARSTAWAPAPSTRPAGSRPSAIGHPGRERRGRDRRRRPRRLTQIRPAGQAGPPWTRLGLLGRAPGPAG